MHQFALQSDAWTTEKLREIALAQRPQVMAGFLDESSFLPDLAANGSDQAEFALGGNQPVLDQLSAALKGCEQTAEHAQFVFHVNRAGLKLDGQHADHQRYGGSESG